jgi:hypothetical protein
MTTTAVIQITYSCLLQHKGNDKQQQQQKTVQPCFPAKAEIDPVREGNLISQHFAKVILPEQNATSISIGETVVVQWKWLTSDTSVQTSHFETVSSLDYDVLLTRGPPRENVSHVHDETSNCPGTQTGTSDARHFFEESASRHGVFLMNEETAEALSPLWSLGKKQSPDA